MSTNSIVSETIAAARNSEFMKLFSRHERQIKSYVVALVPNWSDADDIIAETNMRLWEQFDEFDRGKDFGAWARSVAYYQVLTHRKRAQRNRARLSADVIKLLATRDDFGFEGGDDRLEALTNCVEQLAANHRALLLSVYGRQQPVKHISDQRGSSVGAVYTALSRIRSALSKCIQGRLIEQGSP